MVFKTGPIENIWFVLLRQVFLFRTSFSNFSFVDFSWMVVVVVSMLSEDLEDLLWLTVVSTINFLYFFCYLYILFSRQNLKNAFYCHWELKSFANTLAYLTKGLLCSYHRLATGIIDYITFLRIIAIHNLVLKKVSVFLEKSHWVTFTVRLPGFIGSLKARHIVQH